MNKRRKGMLCIVTAMVIGATLLMSACDLFSQPYRITYWDGEEEYGISVYKGKDYSMQRIPEQYGYTFAGLYDAETGGTQYVGADGKSVSPFRNNGNMILYVQFTPNRYTVNLDYCGAVATSAGGTSVTVEYEHKLPQLPTGLMLTGKEFVGWYTQPDCGGVQIAAADGISQAIVNEVNFNLGSDNTFTVYAGFTVAKITVTFRTETGSLIKSAQVEYGSYLVDAANAVRVNGMAVLSWKGGTEGKVTADTELIAEEYAPFIELDCRGGHGAKEVIARAGSTVFLPTPEKDCCDFLYWADETGKEYTQTVMPEQSVRLKAVWQPKIVLDSNGGSAVDDIVKQAGATVTLPTPTRTGYVFAGWYTQNGAIYNGKTMPEDGISLKAGWCEKQTLHIDFTTGTKEYFVTSKSTFCKVDLSEVNPGNADMKVHVKLHFEAKHYSGKSIAFDGFNDLLLGYYSQATTSSGYTLCPSKTLPHDNVTDYRIYNLEQDITVTDSLFYVAFTNGSVNNGVRVKECYADIEYPDYANVIL